MSRQMKTTLVFILFFIAAAADIFGILTENESVKTIAKPLLLILLTIAYLVSVIRPNLWFLLGLFFSCLGDVLLMFRGANFFTFGLLAFLLAHITYIKITFGFLKSNSRNKIIFSVLPFVIFFTVLITLVYPNLNEMLIPVIVYGVVISTFGSVALLNYRSEKSTENLWLFLGALAFILSDSLLALDKFYESNQIYAVSIMITYILAQFLICKAMIAKSQSTELQNS